VLPGRPNGKTGAKGVKPSAEQQASVAEVATTPTRVGQNNFNSNKWPWDSGAISSYDTKYQSTYYQPSQYSKEWLWYY